MLCVTLPMRHCSSAYEKLNSAQAYDSVGSRRHGKQLRLAISLLVLPCEVVLHVSEYSFCKNSGQFGLDDPPMLPRHFKLDNDSMVET